VTPTPTPIRLAPTVAHLPVDDPPGGRLTRFRPQTSMLELKNIPIASSFHSSPSQIAPPIRRL
jgi:hypothetical protein